MKTYSNEMPKVYFASGSELRIRWNIEQFETEEGTQWVADEALCGVRDDRANLISKIIRSLYTVDAELATINNQTDKPDEYATYQAFRAQAKALADGWINK
jgi:hypothetical protein